MAAIMFMTPVMPEILRLIGDPTLGTLGGFILPIMGIGWPMFIAAASVTSNINSLPNSRLLHWPLFLVAVYGAVIHMHGLLVDPASAGPLHSVSALCAASAATPAALITYGAVKDKLPGLPPTSSLIWAETMRRGVIALYAGAMALLVLSLTFWPKTLLHAALGSAVQVTTAHQHFCRDAAAGMLVAPFAALFLWRKPIDESTLFKVSAAFATSGVLVLAIFLPQIMSSGLMITSTAVLFTSFLGAAKIAISVTALCPAW